MAMPSRGDGRSTRARLLGKYSFASSFSVKAFIAIFVATRSLWALQAAFAHTRALPRSQRISLYAKGFGSKLPTKPKAPQKMDTVDPLRQKRLGKDDSNRADREVLLAEIVEQEFQVGSTTVKLALPAYINDTPRFEAMVEAGIGTVSDIVWPAEQALAFSVLDKKDLWQASGICELGAGLGLVGIAAAVAGAPRVLLTDRDDLVLQLVDKSAELNNVADRVSTRAFDWSDKSRWPDASAFSGLVVGADVLYDAEVVEPLVELIIHLGGEALLMEPNNQERRVLGSVKLFQKSLRQHGLKCTVKDYISPLAQASPFLELSVSRQE